jgi:hypothetical protein
MCANDIHSLSSSSVHNLHSPKSLLAAVIGKVINPHAPDPEQDCMQSFKVIPFTVFNKTPTVRLLGIVYTA